MPNAVMLNPISWRDVVVKHRGDMKAAGREWKRLKRQASANPTNSKPRAKGKGGTAVAKAKKRPAAAPATVTGTTVAGKRVTFKTPMPREWARKWKEGFEAFLARQPMEMPGGWWERWRAGMREFVGQPVEMPPAWVSAWKRGVAAYQPMEMPEAWWSAWRAGLRRRAAQPMVFPEEWRRKWAAGTLAAGPVSPFSATYPEAWEAGVRRYGRTGQPLELAETMRELVSMDTMSHVLAAGAGVAAPTLGTLLYERLTGRMAGPVAAGVLGTASGVSGYVGLNMMGYPSQARTFLGGAVGGILATLILRRLMPGAAAGLGQVPREREIRRAVEESVTRTLRAAGLGQITTEDVREMGSVGQLTYEDVAEELEGVGGTAGLE